MTNRLHSVNYNNYAGGWFANSNNYKETASSIVSNFKMHPGVDGFAYYAGTSYINGAAAKIRLSRGGSQDATPTLANDTIIGVIDAYIAWPDLTNFGNNTIYLKSFYYTTGAVYQTTPKGHGAFECVSGTTVTYASNKAYYLEPHTASMGALESYYLKNTEVQMVNLSTKISFSNNPTYRWGCSKGFFKNTGTVNSTLTAPIWNTGDYDDPTPAVVFLDVTSHGKTTRVFYETEIVSTDAEGTLPVVPPTESGYGLSVRDANNVITFSSATDMYLTKARDVHTVTGAATTIATTNQNSFNSFAIYSSSSANTAGSVPSMHFTADNRLLVASQLGYGGFAGGKIRTFKFKDNVIDGTGYGCLINNLNGDGVLDREDLTYAVAEKGVATNAANWLPTSNGFEYIIVNLNQTYPTSVCPMAAVKSSQSEWISQPSLYSNGTGFDRIYLRRPNGSSANISFAILVDANSGNALTTSSDVYGIQIKSESNETIFDSRWSIPAIQHIQPIGHTYFSYGAYSQGSYDARIGYKGVSAPASTSTPDATQAVSTGEVIEHTLSLDPFNTYVMFGASTGTIIYNKVYNSGNGTYWGGGIHYLNVKIRSNGNARIGMRRYGAGIQNTGALGQLSPVSVNPEGHIILMRIL